MLFKKNFGKKEKRDEDLFTRLNFLVRFRLNRLVLKTKIMLWGKKVCINPLWKVSVLRKAYPSFAKTEMWEVNPHR